MTSINNSKFSKRRKKYVLPSDTEDSEEKESVMKRGQNRKATDDSDSNGESKKIRTEHVLKESSEHNQILH